jgi:hypothetical protein
MGKEIVWDITEGLLVSLGQDQEVTHAVRGNKILKKQEIDQIYGSSFGKLKWPETCLLETRNAAYWALLSHSD